MANEEERVLEEQLEFQLREQKDSLAAIKQALASDPGNNELLEVHEELVQATKDAEDGLLHLKRARLLREADSVFGCSNDLLQDVKVERLDPAEVEPEPLEEQSYSVGSKCRFRFTDGRWYNGKVMQLGSSEAKISFLTPTSENMLMCKFFLQNRCRFGMNCRLSHGIDAPLSSLKKHVPTTWKQSLAGSSIWAVSDVDTGIWREAELASWDEEASEGKVVFRDDGSYVNLKEETIALSEYAEESDDDSECSSEESDCSDYEEGAQGVGFLETTNQQKGIQTDTAIFAKWENHTRGIASKLMANMGYSEGMGLGISGQGMLNPISVKVLPPKQSLDHALESHGGEEERKEQHQGKKRSRGGKRKRQKKFATESRAAKQEEESGSDMFTIINNKLAMHNENVHGMPAKKQQSKGTEEGKKVDRRALVAYDDEIKELKVRVEKLEEMANRNKKEKVVFEAAMRKLIETRQALAEAEAMHASASNAVISKEREKKWLKF